MRRSFVVTVAVFVGFFMMFSLGRVGEADAVKERTIKAATAEGLEIEVTVTPLPANTGAGAGAQYGDVYYSPPPPNVNTWITNLWRYPATFRPRKEMVKDVDYYNAYYRDQKTGLTFYTFNAVQDETWNVAMNLWRPTEDPIWSSARPASWQLLEARYFIFHPTADWGAPCSGGFWLYIGPNVVPLCTGMNGGIISVNITSQCATPGDYDFTVTRSQTGAVLETRTELFTLWEQVPPEDTRLFSQGDYPAANVDNVNTPISVAGCALTASAMVMHYHGDNFGLDPTSSTYATQAVANYNDKVKYKWNAAGESFGAFEIEKPNGNYTRDAAGAIISGFTGDLIFGKADDYTSNVEDMGRIEKLPVVDYLPMEVCAWGPQVLRVKNPPHFVTVLGRTLDAAGVWTWKIHDPGFRGETALTNGYNNTYLGKRLFRHVNDSRGRVPEQMYDIEFQLHSPAELLVTDPDGKMTGLDPISNTWHEEIDNSSYTNLPLMDDTTGLPADMPVIKKVVIVEPIDGEYTIRVTGTGSGDYYINARPYYVDSKIEYETLGGFIPITAGEVHQYSYNFKAYFPPPAEGFTGGYDGGGQRPSDVNKFLRYVRPFDARTRLPAGTQSYKLIVNYGATVDTATFSATLNGKDVTGSFKPAPGAMETVSIPLNPGSNTLILSAEGTIASGRVATDTDRLVFIVK